MKIPFSENSAAHWYHQTAKPAYTMEVTTGKNAGQTRNTTLRDARKLNLLPSITGILRCYPKAQLDKWIKEQAVLARHNNPPPEEAAAPLDSFRDCNEAQRVYFDHVERLANRIRDEACARGNAIHMAAENILAGRSFDERNPHAVAVKGWIDANVETVFFTEKSVVNLDLNVAGRLDACAGLRDGPRPIVLDYKGRAFAHTKKHGWRAKRRKSDLIQLAFYASTMSDAPRIANLYVANDRDEPLIELVEYTDEERQTAFGVLESLVKIWQFENNYVPEIDHEKILKHLEAQNGAG